MLYLVANGLGAAPLQKNLFDAAGARHPETLRALQFGFGVHWFGATAGETERDKSALAHLHLRNKHVLTTSAAISLSHLFPASDSSRSKMDLRAWAPMLRGSVCDLTSSRLLSPTCPKDLSLLTSASL